jgi:hypothetical protein
MFQGEKIDLTEKSAVLHVALRFRFGGHLEETAGK